MGQQVLFDGDDEHDGKFQPFGRVQCHQGHLLRLVVPGVGVVDQRSLFQERFQTPRFDIARVKFPRGGHQFFQVGGAILIFGEIRCLQLLQIPGFLEHVAAAVFPEDRLLSDSGDPSARRMLGLAARRSSRPRRRTALGAPPPTAFRRADVRGRPADRSSFCQCGAAGTLMIRSSDMSSLGLLISRR